MLKIGWPLLTVLLWAGAASAQPKLVCMEGPKKTVGEGIDASTTQTKTCTYGRITVKDTATEDAQECKLTCHAMAYFVKKGKKSVEVKLGALFNKKAPALLTRINAALKKELAKLVAANADCFEGKPTYKKLGFSDLQLSLSKAGFHFSASTPALAHCKGPAGEVGMKVPFSAMKPYL